MENNKWSYLNVYTTDPAWNLALEEYIFDYLPRDRNYFMLWQNDNSVIIGRHQNTLAEIDRAYVRANKVNVVRRLSGGGAVYHDMGNLNFTFIADAKELQTLNFKMFCEPVVEALKYYGVTAVINGRNDITIDGQKFSGNAQYLREGRVMHHGTIIFNSDLDRVSGALNVDSSKISAKGIASVRSRVTTVCRHLPYQVTLEEFRKTLLQQILQNKFADEYQLTDSDIEKIRYIKEQRYDTWEWNYGRSLGCQMVKNKRFPAVGNVEINLTTDCGVIKEIFFHGDFFSVSDLAALERCLVGVQLKEESLYEVLKAIDVGQYIVGMRNEDLIEELLS